MIFVCIHEILNIIPEKRVFHDQISFCLLDDKLINDKILSQYNFRAKVTDIVRGARGRLKCQKFC
jgi:hypothetical protein